MELEWAQLVIPASAYDAASVLGGWADILGPNLSVLLPTRLGHVFLEHADGTVWFLDTWSGGLTLACDSYEQFKAQVSQDDDFMARYLMPEVVADLVDSGRVADGDKCYSAVVSPGIGGSFDPKNFIVGSLRVHLATSAAEYSALHGK